MFLEKFRNLKLFNPGTEELIKSSTNLVRVLILSFPFYCHITLTLGEKHDFITKSPLEHHLPFLATSGAREPTSRTHRSKLNGEAG